ncbi:class I SAM-dependent methyltransferase [Synechococcus elongatus]|uniref:Methyltransferase domain-containing protein n=1 Tax=Synechococcus elongatus PCC 11801 TaxID=2219813 RepID=A0AAN1QM61_SYNEL|nr:class I SAM-dependent methyltransferase [Synechococcus elongatus]AZB71715.1 SAM-dependent methyltransferase [Synechococcus elongatus PCC 11801]
MTSILRPLSYRYAWLYDTVTALSSVPVGGPQRLRQLLIEPLTLPRSAAVLDLCCGGGVTTAALCQRFDNVMGLDAAATAIERAKALTPQASYVVAQAEAMPFEAERFDLVHTSVALHEMTPEQRQQILQEAWRVLRPAGTLAILDLHQPHNPLFWPAIALFIELFETETAWQLVQSDLIGQLRAIGFDPIEEKLYSGGSLQALWARKPSDR